MICYNCKATIQDGSLYCQFCGQMQECSPELIAAAAAGNEAALTELYNRTYSSVYNTVRFLVRDEDAVLDIVQDSYLRAFRSLGQLREAEKFGPWVKRIAHNRAIDYLRQKKPVAFSEMLPDDSDEAVEFEDDRPENLPEVAIDRRETARLIGEILDSLPEDQRACITMFYYEQLSVNEIAAELNIPEATVKSRLQYGRKKIETQVRNLERKGTKLYGIAPIPFFLLLLRSQAVQAAEIPSGALLENILMVYGSGAAAAAAGAAGAGAGMAGAGAAGGAAGAGAGMAGAGAAGGAAGGIVGAGSGMTGAAGITGSAAGVTEAAGAAGTTLAIKIAAAVAAVAVIGGGVMAVRSYFPAGGKSGQSAAQTAEAFSKDNDPEGVTILSTEEEAETPPTEEPENTPTPAPTEEPAATPAPEMPAEPAVSIDDAYEKVRARYLELADMGAEAFFDQYGNQSFYDENSEGIQYEVIADYFRDDTGALAYALYDYNGDGVEEMAVGRRGDEWFSVNEIYTFDGKKAVQLFKNPSIGYRSSISVLPDGTFVFQGSNGAAAGSLTVCRIADDRSGLEILGKYEYDAEKYGDSDFHNVGGEGQNWNDFDSLSESVEVSEVPGLVYPTMR